MNLDIADKKFIVCGATRGFGLAVLQLLIQNDAQVIAVARNLEELKKLKDRYPGKVDILHGDITRGDTIMMLAEIAGKSFLGGILVNSSGPPAKSFHETTLDDWDEAYRSILRWKVELTKVLLPCFQKQQYGRFIFIESASIKQPLENLVLSNALRLSVAGFVKTISQEIPEKGITFNILAPGYHLTSAVERVIAKKSESSGLSYDDARKMIENEIPAQKMGDPGHFASLATWLLSPLSDYVTGQVFAIDGGLIKFPL